MKKKLMGIVTIIAIAAVAGYNVYASRSNVKLSDLALANVEALADSSEGSQSDCNTYCILIHVSLDIQITLLLLVMIVE